MGRIDRSMNDDQRRARIFGVLFILTFLTSIPALALFQPVLDDPAAYIAGAGKDNQIYLGALLEFLLIIANVGTAVVLYPIARRQNEILALGYVRNGLILGYLMYSSGLVPRRMAWLGLVGGPLLLVSSIGTLFDWWDAGTTVPAILVIPEFLWELSLGIYCAVRGFRRDSPILLPPARSSELRAVAT